MGPRVRIPTRRRRAVFLFFFGYTPGTRSGPIFLPAFLFPAVPTFGGVLASEGRNGRRFFFPFLAVKEFFPCVATLFDRIYADSPFLSFSQVSPKSAVRSR